MGDIEMTDGRRGSRDRRLGLAIVGLAIAMVAGACSGAGGGGGGAGTTTITLAAVDNPSMADLKKLVGAFQTAHPTIKVNIVTLPEDQLRQQVTQDVAANSGRYDLFTIGTYEGPLWAKKGWIENISTYLAKASSYAPDDLIPGIRGALSYNSNLYAVPFYGESSMLMYRKDMLSAAGVTMPDHPTWDQVAAAAQKVNSSSVNGICLRGLPGWGEQLAPLDTVVNTFGGRWFDEKGTAQPHTPAQKPRARRPGRHVVRRHRGRQLLHRRRSQELGLRLRSDQGQGLVGLAVGMVAGRDRYVGHAGRRLDLR